MSAAQITLRSIDVAFDVLKIDETHGVSMNIPSIHGSRRGLIIHGQPRNWIKRDDVDEPRHDIQITATFLEHSSVSWFSQAFVSYLQVTITRHLASRTFSYF